MLKFQPANETKLFNTGVCYQDVLGSLCRLKEVIGMIELDDLPESHQRSLLRRIKVIYLDPSWVVTILNWAHSPTRYLTIPDYSEAFPEGAFISYMDIDMARGCFKLFVCHENFPEVPIGEVPEVVGQWGIRGHTVDFGEEVEGIH